MLDASTPEARWVAQAIGKRAVVISSTLTSSAESRKPAIATAQAYVPAAGGAGGGAGAGEFAGRALLTDALG